ncbi:cytochrome P450 [Perilla frutescens var. hirtella]|nr:cytochrome P450 [Perilla frutescens var. hirtella]
MAAEKLLINHFCHEHPLILTQNFVSNEPLDCFACEKPIVSECVYACIEHKYCNNKSRSVIHKKCAELPTQILHPSHPHHPLHLFEDQVTGYKCNLCRDYFRSVLRYRCHRCDFDIDITCKKLSIDELFGERSLTHPSHHHPLTLMRKLPCLIACDACGTEDRDMVYSCCACDLFVHKACALLPTSLPTNQHHHQLSLAFCFPIKYRKYRYQCAICDEYCNLTCWLYYCGDCRYFCHLKCATSTAQIAKQDFLSKDETTDLIELPLHDISKELITPFVMREEGLHSIPNVNDMPQTSVTRPDSDKHPLVLTFDASPDHPSDFFCDVCETEMHPKRWMYHCRQCDNSLHISCIHHTLINRSSVYFKFGRRLQLDDIHPHSLTFKLSILKKRCNICSKDVYAILGFSFGFECASCNYLIAESSSGHPHQIQSSQICPNLPILNSLPPPYTCDEFPTIGQFIPIRFDPYGPPQNQKTTQPTANSKKIEAKQQNPSPLSGWPILGENVELALLGYQKFVRDRMQKYSPEIFKTSLLGEKTVVFCSAQGNKFLFSNENKLVAYWLPQSIKMALLPEFVESDGKEALITFHKIQCDALKQEALREYVQVVDSLARELLEKDWRPNSVVKVFPSSKKYTFELVCRVFLNVEGLHKLVDPFSLLGNGMVSMPIDLPGTAFNPAIKAGKVVREQMEIAESKGPDEMLTWEDVEKMKYSWNVAREMLRLAPPAQGAFRVAIAEFNYLGFTIPNGWKTFWTVHASHQDPDYFLEPEKFDPSRFEGAGPSPYTFVPFGGGPQICSGRNFAKLAILVFMHNVVTRFGLEKVIPNEKMLFHARLTPAHGLPLHLHPYKK